MFVLLLLADAAAMERHEQTPDGEQPYVPSGFPSPRSLPTTEVKALSLPSKEGWLGQAGWVPGGPLLRRSTASSAGHTTLRKPGRAEPRSHCPPPPPVYE